MILKALVGPFLISSRDSTLSIMTKLQYEWYGVWIPARAPDFSLLQNVHTDPGTHPACYSAGTGAKAAEAWSWPRSAYDKFKNEWNYTSFPLYSFIAWQGSFCVFTFHRQWLHFGPCFKIRFTIAFTITSQNGILRRHLLGCSLSLLIV
jgi:hypothetical protein